MGMFVTYFPSFIDLTFHLFMHEGFVIIDLENLLVVRFACNVSYITKLH